MYSEIGFIFDDSISIGLENKNNTGSIYGKSMKVRLKPKKANSTTAAGNVNPTPVDQSTNGKDATATNTNNTNNREVVDAVLVYKRPGYVGDIPNYLKDSVYKEDNNEDPYIGLIRNFSQYKSLKLRPADFAYLKDLGVYPINRLWILRRFPENCVVPNNLLDWGPNSVEPISTVVGWLKYKEDSDLFGISFNEVWTDQNAMLDKVFADILKDATGMELKTFMSVPGWSQGILFGILNKMGLTSDFNSRNVPTGDPNVLRVAKMRDTDAQGLDSRLTVTLETSYEQKYINGIDPGMAMMDIYLNLFRMGTSNQKFVLGNSPELQMLLTGVMGQPGLDPWLKLAKKLLTDFISGIELFIQELTNDTSAIGAGLTEEEQAKIASDKARADMTDDQKKEDDKIKRAEKSAADAKKQGEGKVAITADAGQIKTAMQNIGEILLAGTVSKFRWKLRGSIGLMSGMNTTPWHLTLGNPYSPILNLGNIVVGAMDIKWNNEMGFNDMPTGVNVTIPVSMGRPLGETELMRMVNNGYKRVYAVGEELNRNNQSSTSDGLSAEERQSNAYSTASVRQVGGVDTKTVGIGSNQSSVRVDF